MSNTFLAQQVDVDDLTRACDSALEFLLKHNFVIVVGTASSGEKQGDDYGLSSTQLGQASGTKWNQVKRSGRNAVFVCALILCETFLPVLPFIWQRHYNKCASFLVAFSLLE